MSELDKDQLKRLLLDHYKNPRNRVSEPMEDASIVERGHNPQCGDEIEVGLYIEGQTIKDIKFRGRGCSICIATASIMTEHIKGQSLPASAELATTTLHWLKHEIHTNTNTKINTTTNPNTKDHTNASSNTKVNTNTSTSTDTNTNANNNTSTNPTSTLPTAPPTPPPIPAMAIALNFPIRWRCTSLAWQALHTALTAGAQAS